VAAAAFSQICAQKRWTTYFEALRLESQFRRSRRVGGNTPSDPFLYF
jgi:hypothetical protein